MPGPDDQDEKLKTPPPAPSPGGASADESTIGPAPEFPRLERYEILGELGRGGMGVVYRARDRETDETVALKALKPEIAADPRLHERFKNEMRLARKITHRNVCRIFDIHRTPTGAYISMEYVEGESLRQMLRRSGRLPLRTAIEILRQMCAGLREAQNQGVVHRDLKPENVMLDRAGTAKIMDFGIARTVVPGSTLTGVFLGTPAYMSPEQAEGKRPDHRADIYALGLVLFEMCTGSAPFHADTPLALALKHVRETPPRPRDLEPMLPASLDKLILRCMEKNPDDRYASFDELDAALQEELAALSTRTPSPAPSHHPSRRKSDVAGLPDIERAKPRSLFLLIQFMYTAFYVLALAKLEFIHSLIDRFAPALEWPVAVTVLVTGVMGLAARLYMLSAVSFDFLGFGKQFHRIFPGLMALDYLWALAPFLLVEKIGIGLAFAATVALLFLPFSQRTLVRMAYDL